VASLLALFRHRDAELLRQHPHRFGKCDLFVQFQKLEDIAAGVAPETMEEALFLIDCKRGRFLGMEGTQPLELHARLLQGHVVLDHAYDVGLETQVVDETLGEHQFKPKDTKETKDTKA